MSFYLCAFAHLGRDMQLMPQHELSFWAIWFSSCDSLALEHETPPSADQGRLSINTVMTFD